MQAFVPSVGISTGLSLASQGPRLLRAGRRPCGRVRAAPPRACAGSPDVHDLEEEVRVLLVSSEKGKQQRGLLLVRQLPPPVALDLLILSVRTSKNEFIRSTATVGLGQLYGADPTTRARAIRTLLEILGSDSDYSVRAAAAAGCGYLANKPCPETHQVVEQLIRGCYEDHEWQVQFSCIVSLGSLRDQRALPVILRALKSDNELIVQGAVGAIGDLADPRTITPLLDCLSSQDKMTRQRLAQALGSFPAEDPKPAIIDALRTLARDPCLAVREAAGFSLERYGCSGPAKEDTLSDQEKLDLEVAALLNDDETDADRKASESAANALRRRLERSFDKGAAARELMNYSSDQESEPRPMEAVTPGESSPSAVGAAAMRPADSAMNRKVDEPLAADEIAEYKHLVDTLRTGDLTARSLAVVQLRKVPNRIAMHVVTEANVVNDPSERIRGMIIPIFAKAKDMSTIVALLRDDIDQSVRAGACDALVEAGGGPSAVATCLKAFETDMHWLVRICAAMTLGKIGIGHPEVEDGLIRSLKSTAVSDLEPPQDCVVQRHVVTALGNLASVKALPVLRELVESPETEEAIRFRIAGCLREIPSAESAKLARLLVNDESDAVGELAQVSLDILQLHGYV